MFSHVRN